MSRLDKAPRGLPGPLGVVGGGHGYTDEQRLADQRGQLTNPLPAPEPAEEPAEQPERKQKVGGWNGYPSNLARIRAAWFHTQTKDDGWPSLSEMTEQLLLREAERLEREHNAGERFPEVPAGKVKHSRRN